MNRNFQIQPRRSVTGPVQLQQAPRNDVLQDSEVLVRFALGLLAEDERRRLRQGEDVPFGRWLSGPSASRIQDKVARLVAAAADIRLRPDLNASAFTTTTSFAAHAKLERTRLLADLAPRSQLVPSLMAAGFAVDGLLGPVRAYLLYANGGQAGRDAHAFGIHNVKGESAFSRVMGVAALGPDTCVPVTAHALITGMPEDRESVARGRKAMEEWGFELPANLAGHVAVSLQLVNAARQVVHEAVAGSRTCLEARIRADHMLAVGFSRWVLLGSVQVGPRLSGTVSGGCRIYPGLDARVLRAAKDERFHPLAHAADLTVSEPSLDAVNAEIMYVAGGQVMQGGRLLTALLEGNGAAVPGLRELSHAQLRAVEEHARGQGIPCTIQARYLIVPQGLALTSNGTPLKVSALVRIGPHASMMWTATVDLAKPDALASAVARAELHVRSLEDRTLNGAVQDYFADHDLHRLQAETYKTHMAMRIVTMLANLAAVGVARQHQAGRGPTRY